MSHDLNFADAPLPPPTTPGITPASDVPVEDSAPAGLLVQAQRHGSHHGHHGAHDNNHGNHNNHGNDGGQSNHGSHDDGGAHGGGHHVPLS